MTPIYLFLGRFFLKPSPVPKAPSSAKAQKKKYMIYNISKFCRMPFLKVEIMYDI
jgi:hypothetical protein